MSELNLDLLLSPISSLPDSQQSFASIRRQGRIYVDKTAFVYALAFNNNPRFLSRPRRFGKSTLLSTLQELFDHGVKGYDGHDSYFRDLVIERYWKEDKHYPVLCLSFADINYECTTAADFKQRFIRALDEKAKALGIVIPEDLPTPSERFKYLVRQFEDGSLVLLVDEYDAPLTYRIEAPEEEYNAVVQTLRGFYGVIKEQGHKFRCVFITGITRYKDSALFTAGDAVEDISQDPRFGEICGYTRAEIKQSFYPQLCLSASKVLGKTVAGISPQDVEKLLDILTEWYDGYCFDSAGATHVFSTWSVLKFLGDPLGSLDSYWYKSGGQPKILQRAFFSGDLVQTLSEIVDGNLSVPLSAFVNPQSLQSMDRRVLLFQTGYLTLAEAYRGPGDTFADVNRVKLKFPNREAEVSFKHLLSDYLFSASKGGEDIFRTYQEWFLKALTARNADALMQVFNVVINSVDCFHFPIKEESMLAAILGIFMLCCGVEVNVGEHQARGIVDTRVRYDRTHLILEYKFVRRGEKPATRLQQAVQQICDRRYGETLKNVNSWRVAAVYAEEERSIVLWQEI